MGSFISRELATDEDFLIGERIFIDAAGKATKKAIGAQFGVAWRMGDVK